MPGEIRRIAVGIVGFLAASVGFLLSVLAWVTGGFPSHFLRIMPVESMASFFPSSVDSEEPRARLGDRARRRPSHRMRVPHVPHRPQMVSPVSFHGARIAPHVDNHTEIDSIKSDLSSPPMVSPSTTHDPMDDTPSVSSSDDTRVHVETEHEGDTVLSQASETESPQIVHAPPTRSPKRLSLHLPHFKLTKLPHNSRPESATTTSTLASQSATQLPHHSRSSSEDNTVTVQRCKSLSTTCLSKLKSKREAAKQRKRFSISKSSAAPVARTDPYGPTYNFPLPTSPVPRDYFRRRVAEQYTSPPSSPLRPLTKLPPTVNVH